MGQPGPIEPAELSDIAEQAPSVVELTTSEQLGLGPERPFTVADRIGLLVERVDEWRDRPLLVAAVVAVVAGLALAVPSLVASEPPGQPIEDRIPQVALTPTTALAGTSTVFVHVSGAVRLPGVYTLDATARVFDAVDAAGGVTADAELHLLNLAALVIDGQQIRVPVEGESVAATTPAASGPIDLNRADVVGLQDLPGVGPATAEAILAHREEHGPFRSVDDLLDVPGIGPSKLAAIADEAIVR